MKRLLILTLLFFSLTSEAQVKLYDPNADAKKALNEAIQQAKESKKHVLVQIGGNWCPWCVKLHNFINSDEKLKKVVDENYVVVKVNYSKENKNTEVLKLLENPQRFGFPVLVVLDDNGRRIHTQDSGLLESGEGYDIKKVTNFLEGWTKSAIYNPKR